VTWGLSAMAFFEMILNFGATPRDAGLTAGARFMLKIDAESTPIC